MEVDRKQTPFISKFFCVAHDFIFWKLWTQTQVRTPIRRTEMLAVLQITLHHYRLHAPYGVNVPTHSTHCRRTWTWFTHTLAAALHEQTYAHNHCRLTWTWFTHTFTTALHEHDSCTVHTCYVTFTCTCELSSAIKHAHTLRTWLYALRHGRLVTT